MTWRRPWVLVAVMLVALRGRALAQSTEGEIVLAPGEQKTLPGDGVDSFSIGSPNVLEIRKDESDGRRRLFLVGKEPGATSLVLYLTSGQKLTYKVTVSHILARHNVQLDVYYVQVTRSWASAVGLSWPTRVGATVQGSASFSTGEAAQRTLSITSSVLPQLDFAAEHGWAKLLDYTKVVMASGEEGSYASGGDLNVQVSTGLSAGLEKVTFGSRVKARVTYDPSTGRVEVTIDAELSRLSEARGSEVPGVSRTQVQTTVNMALGESLALGGLFSTQEVHASAGIPILGELPVIGYLFARKARSHDHRENVLFVVPSLVSPVSIEDRDRVREALRVYRGFDGDGLGDGVARLRADSAGGRR